jgi:hypothetical protein
MGGIGVSRPALGVTPTTEQSVWPVAQRRPHCRLEIQNGHALFANGSYAGQLLEFDPWGVGTFQDSKPDEHVLAFAHW